MEYYKLISLSPTEKLNTVEKMLAIKDRQEQKELQRQQLAAQQQEKKEQKLLSAYGAINSLSETINKMGINEEEIEFKTNLYNQVDTMLNNLNETEDYMTTWKDVVDTTSSLMTDPKITSKVKANKDYQDWRKNLYESGLPQEIIEYYDATQTYTAGKYEDNNRGITTWKPTESWVEQPDIVKLQEQAMKLAAAEEGSYDTIYYMGRNGEYTDNIKESIDGVPYYKIGTEYNRLTEAKIKSAFNNIVRNNPKIMAGLEQDYKIDKWRHENGKTTFVDVTTDDAGIMLNFDDYINKRLYGFSKPASYNNVSQNITTMAGLSTSVIGKGINSKNNSSDKTLFSESYVTGVSYIPKTDSFESVMAGKNVASTILKDECRKLNLQFNPNEIDKSFQQIEEYYRLVDTELPKEIQDAYNSYNEYSEYYNNLINNIQDPELKNKIDFITTLDLGADLSTLTDENGDLNPYVKQYSSLINQLFKDNDVVEFELDGNKIKSLQDFKNIFPDYEQYGVSYNNGKITLNKTNANNLSIIGKKLKGFYKNVFKADIPNTHSGRKGILLDSITKLYDDINKDVEHITSEDNILIPSQVISQNDVITTLARQARLKEEDIKDVIISEIESGLRNAGYENSNMAIGYDNINPTYKNTGDQRVAAGRLLVSMLNDSANKDLVGIGYDNQTLEQVFTITIPNPKEGKYPEYITKFKKIMDIDDLTNRVIIRWDGIGQETKNLLKNSPQFKYGIKLGELNNAGIKNVNISDNYQLKIDNGQFMIYENGFYKNISKDQAIECLSIKDMLSDINYYAKSPKTNFDNLLNNYVDIIYRLNDGIDKESLKGKIIQEAQYMNDNFRDYITSISKPNGILDQLLKIKYNEPE